MRTVAISQIKYSPLFEVYRSPSGSIVVTNVTEQADQSIANLLHNVEIHRINGISVFGLPLEHVQELIGSCTKLEMLVSGRECTYQWIDVNTLEITSAPPSSYLTRIDHPLYTNRWITLNTHNIGTENNQSRLHLRKPLGLVIRGGSEYGLGIFVSKVEKNTSAAEAGLLVSDQIINVNGHDFRDIPHSKAVRALRAYATLRLLVRYIGKLPEPAQQCNQPFASSLTLKNVSSSSVYELKKYDPLTKLPEGMQELLRKYRQRNICIDELMNNLIPSISSDKAYLFDQIRNAIRAIDKDRYDNYVLRLEVGRLRRMTEVTTSCLSLRDFNTTNKQRKAEMYTYRNPYGQISSCSADIGKLRKNTNDYDGEDDDDVHNRNTPCPLYGSGVAIKIDKYSPTMSYLSSMAQQYLKLYLNPELIVVEKCRPFLGIAIEGNGNVKGLSSKNKRGSVYCPFPRVVYLHPDGASSICGRIGLGYLLIQVNNRCLEGLTHRQAARLIANLYKQPHPTWLQFVVAAPKLTMIN